MSSDIFRSRDGVHEPVLEKSDIPATLLLKLRIQPVLSVLPVRIQPFISFLPRSRILLSSLPFQRRALLLPIQHVRWSSQPRYFTWNLINGLFYRGGSSYFISFWMYTGLPWPTSPTVLEPLAPPSPPPGLIRPEAASAEDFFYYPLSPADMEVNTSI